MARTPRAKPAAARRHERKPRGRAAPRTWDRRPNPERRVALLDRVAEHLLDRGLAGCTLSGAAEAAGTSAQLLVHYFGTKERLVDEAIAAATRRHLGSVFGTEMVPGDFDEAFWSRWRRLTSAEYLRFLPLMYEILTASLRTPQRFTLIRREIFERWQKGFARSLTDVGVGREAAVRLSTAYVAALRGLLLDLLVTGERRRVTAAATLVAENLKRDLMAALSGSPGA